jgi:hypothetical protein
MAAKDDGQSNDETSFLRTVNNSFLLLKISNPIKLIYSNYFLINFKIIGRLYLFKLFCYNTSKCEQKNGFGS